MANFFNLEMVYSDKTVPVMVNDEKTGLRRLARFKHKTAATEAARIIDRLTTACHYSHCRVLDCTTAD